MFEKAWVRMVLMVGAVVLLPVGIAQGQSNSYSRMLDTGRTLQQNLFDEMNRTQALRRRGEKIARGSQKASPAPRPVAHLPLAMTDFRPVEAGHPAIKQFVDGLSLPPEARATMENAITQVWAGIEATTRPNNLASSIGGATVVATLLLTGKEQDDVVVTEQIAGINDALATSSFWLGMAPRGKQALSESFVLIAAVMLVYAEVGKADAGMKQASLTMARDLLSRLGAAPAL